MQSVEIPAVTQTRVSADYMPGGENWIIGDATIIAHALGLAAFKDVRIILDYCMPVHTYVCMAM